jgi:hypothetical protein
MRLSFLLEKWPPFNQPPCSQMRSCAYPFELSTSIYIVFITFRWSTTSTDPKTPSQLQPQFNALCQALKLDPEAPDTLSTIKDPIRTPWSLITHLIETDALGQFGTFRGASSADWVTVNPGLMEWQRSGGLARGLKEHGVKSILIGDLIDEWYLYSIAHPINGPSDLLPNLERYFPKAVAEHMIDAFPQLSKDAGSKEATRLYGDIMSFGQVHLPVRLFARDMASNGFPVLRYEIRWTPEQHRPFGKFVLHMLMR